MSRTRDLGKIISGNFDVPATALDNAATAVNTNVSTLAITRSNISDLGTAALSNRNLIINGKCSVNQRGNNTGTNSVTGPDRFFIHSNNPSGHVIESSNQKDGPSGFDNCFQYKTTAAVTSPAADMYTGFAHKFEVQDVIPYIWSGASHVTASFWVKSSIAGTFTFNINPEEATGGGSADRILYESTYTINSTNTWEYKTITIPLSFLSSYALLSSHTDNNTGLEITWPLDIISGGNRTNITAGWNTPASEARNMVTSTGGSTGFFTTVNSTFRITGIQFEVGDTATPFEHRSYGDELVKCQRYYEEPNGSARVGDPSSGTYSVQYNYIVTKRATPTISTTTEGTRVGVSSHGIQSNNLNNCAEQVAVTASLNYGYSANVNADAEL